MLTGEHSSIFVAFFFYFTLLPAQSPDSSEPQGISTWDSSCNQPIPYRLVPALPKLCPVGQHWVDR